MNGEIFQTAMTRTLRAALALGSIPSARQWTFAADKVAPEGTKIDERLLTCYTRSPTKKPDGAKLHALLHTCGLSRAQLKEIFKECCNDLIIWSCVLTCEKQQWSMESLVEAYYEDQNSQATQSPPSP